MAEKFANNFQTTIVDGGDGIDDSQTTVGLGDAPPAGLSGGAWRLLVESEIILVTAFSGSSITACSRGAEGTTPAAHAETTAATHILTAGAIAELSGTIDHGGVGGLGDDDHPQYVHLSVARTRAVGDVFNDLFIGQIYQESEANKLALEMSHFWGFALRVYNYVAANYPFTFDLNGNLTLLGTVDGVDIAAHAAAADAHHAKGDIWVDDGDDAAFDRAVGNFTLDATWRDWDISSLVGAKQCMVLLRVELRNNTAGEHFAVRQNGNSNAINTSKSAVVVANLTHYCDLLVQTDASGVIEYYGANGGTWATVNVSVRGRFETVSGV